MKFFGSLMFASLLSLITGAEIPPTWKVCSRNDPDLSNCFRKAIQHALPHLKDGLKQFGIPPLEPLILGNVSVKGNPDSPLNLDQKLTNAKIHNVSLSTVTSAQVLYNRKEFQVTLGFFNNKPWIEGGYELVGKVFETPINASGHARLDFIDVSGTDIVTGEFYEKDGKRYIKVTDASAKIFPTKITHKLDDPNADKKMLRETEKLLDEKWDQIWEGVRKHYEDGCGVLLKHMFQSVFDTYSTDQLFPA